MLLLMMSCGVTSAKNMQDDSISINIKEPEIFERAEVMPTFPGGTESLMKFLFQNIKYPKYARENGLEGKVIIKFYVDKEGNIREAEVLNDVDNSLKKEALRIISIMPKWNPALQRGKPVNCYYVLPVTFKLA